MSRGHERGGLTTRASGAAQMFSILLGERCVGFILARGNVFEAFDASEKTLGHFGSAKEAASAVMEAAASQDRGA